MLKEVKKGKTIFSENAVEIFAQFDEKISTLKGLSKAKEFLYNYLKALKSTDGYV